MKKKVLIAVSALALVLVIAIGGTVAWLTAKTTEVKNTFTYGDINIALAETTGNDYKMIPGSTIKKDPTVTVEADSEACWLFVKAVKSNNFDNFMTYTMADGWIALEGVDNVYYRSVDVAEANTDFAVIANNTVKVKDNVTKEALNALTENTYPTLTFTAYAVQKENMNDASAAWNAANFS